MVGRQGRETRIGAIIRVCRPRVVTADSALRLGCRFGTTPEFWRNPQAAYDLSMTVVEAGARIEAMGVRGRPERGPHN